MKPLLETMNKNVFLFSLMDICMKIEYALLFILILIIPLYVYTFMNLNIPVYIQKHNKNRVKLFKLLISNAYVNHCQLNCINAILF
jgi:hypothetical protein